ncbi:unnamed protein product [Arabidopsis thaliana]|jgi:DNA-nicking Smr family endonuclease|uniref:Smr (Small MutS Related) domain-containing protein n=2 Tax=Arabidopsis thaliana TaxID=3702 RepID=Q9LT11_ARATH|nr:smr (Small MutS Related) domain-containing protein [Arabidopsis thaliana]NP_197743.1 smr (Small MutS Related) domain-containing protein [Arabidopsis thaliana]AAM97100.1 unknown protein [Arabidopsis thaliana]AAN15535.1 unknown protein [Arabidopsis thaliana]AED93178.1 smr (Small MutS Related) domain-containing protein [Arabidopsis thaliana]ANM68609.1 smr (Small MutS Related) domain-containing protein [Arabidopsis thaliana]VYS67696.1 unnamed protein product [Arabidopsis thaliana]|eukprot:NP_001330345.1 smr (Small MutS Related) domain-containing protein [Arabidopsis thaliana]
MSWMKGKSSGWTAFDLKQRQKQGLESEVEGDPFPPVSTSVNASFGVRGRLRRNHEPSEKSFSSVLLPPSRFPALTENKDCGNQERGGCCRRKPDTLSLPVNSHDLAFTKLKEMNSWADDNLIRDVLLSTEDDFEMALAFLKGMVSSGKEDEEPTSKIEGYSSDNRRSEYRTFEKTVTSSVKMAARSTFEDAGKYDLENSDGSSFLVNASDNEKFPDDISELDSIIQRLQSIPIEPEWEEDDLYLSHRKDALKVMRSASNHSRAAQNAFQRYDHASAKQHSDKAREDWLAAEKLNAEAAKKIIGITNKDNDIWKLDLHGLHATEAVQALQERLQMIEGHFTVNRSVSPNRGRSKNAALRSASQEPFGRLDEEGMHCQRTSSRELRNSLQVITGIGKHSRGQASLPLAVKTFFEDNRYRFDETRPGVITVRPKFRHS